MTSEREQLQQAIDALEGQRRDDARTARPGLVPTDHDEGGPRQPLGQARGGIVRRDACIRSHEGGPDGTLRGALDLTP